MAANVFGTPITNETLKGMVEYHDKSQITRVDRARVAMEMKNAEGKDVNARKFVENLRQTDGASSLNAMGLVYNATGDTVILGATHDYDGYIGLSPYPMVLANGQWGAFLHVGNERCKGGIAYYGQNDDGSDTYWLFAWHNSNNDAPYNKAYTEIGRGHSADYYVWQRVGSAMSSAGVTTQTSSNGCLAFTTIGNRASPMFEGIMTLKGAI